MIIGLVGLGSVISAVAFYPPVLPSLEIDRSILRNNLDPGIVLPCSSKCWLYEGFRGDRPVRHRLAYHFLRRLGSRIDLGQYVGAPSHDNAAVYFIAKTLILLSW